MDLSERGRIDTDFRNMTVLSTVPVGDDILDPLLSTIQAHQGSEARSVDYWLDRLARPEFANQVRRQAASRLVVRGILDRDPGGVISLARQVSRTRRYPGVSLPEGQDVVLRLMNVLLNDDIPGPREAMLVALADSCGILRHFLTPSEFAEREDRIDVVRRLDLIGRSVRSAILTAIRPVSFDDSLRRAFPGQSARPRHSAPPLAPGAVPVLGHVLHLRPWPPVPLALHFRSLGPVFRIREFGRELTVLAGPEANSFCQQHGHALFRSQDRYAPMFEAMDAQRVILSMDGEEHFTLRRGISSGFSADSYRRILPRVRDIVIGEVPDGRTARASRLFTRHTAKSIALACTGTEISSRQVDDMDLFVRRLIACAMLGVLPGFMLRSRSVLRARDGFLGVFDGMLRDRLDRLPEQGENVVDRLLDLHRANPQLLPERELRASCLGPIFAGLHTTASTGAFAMYMLLRHPEILDRVRAEAEHLHEGGEPKQERLKDCDVTRRVVLETLRMYSPFPAVYRTAINTFEFGGYVIPAGTRLFLPIAVPSYCPEIFPQPQVFDIERFLPKRQEHMQPGCYLPYGFGTHRCLGSSIADLHLIFSLTTMLHHFDVQLAPPSYRLKIVIAGVPEPSRGYGLKFTKRR